MKQILKNNLKDSVLNEIHAIQEKHYEERENLNWCEQKKIIDKNVSDIEIKYKIKFKIVKPKNLIVSA